MSLYLKFLRFFVIWISALSLTSANAIEVAKSIGPRTQKSRLKVDSAEKEIGPENPNRQTFEVPQACPLQVSSLGTQKPKWKAFKGSLKKGSVGRLKETSGSLSSFVVVESAYKNLQFKAATDCLMPKVSLDGDVVKTPLVQIPAMPTPIEAPAKIVVAEDKSNHRGFVAYFGLIYFQEKFQLIGGPVTDPEELQSKSTGFNAGFSVEYEFSWLNLSFDFGIIGAYNSVLALTPGPSSYASAGLVLGGTLRPNILFRLGKIELGPTFPMIFRYASYQKETTGEVTTKNFQPYFSLGGALRYDFGETRVSANFSKLPKDCPYFSLELQFEL